MYPPSTGKAAPVTKPVSSLANAAGRNGWANVAYSQQPRGQTPCPVIGEGVFRVIFWCGRESATFPCSPTYCCAGLSRSWRFFTASVRSPRDSRRTRPWLHLSLQRHGVGLIPLSKNSGFRWHYRMAHAALPLLGAARWKSSMQPAIPCGSGTIARPIGSLSPGRSRVSRLRRDRASRRLGIQEGLAG